MLGRSVGARGTVTIRLVKRLGFMSITDTSVIRERVRFNNNILHLISVPECCFHDLTFGIWAEICSSHKERRIVSKRI